MNGYKVQLKFVAFDREGNEYDEYYTTSVDAESKGAAVDVAVEEVRNITYDRRDELVKYRVDIVDREIEDHYELLKKWVKA